jgi:hypothetical protein
MPLKLGCNPRKPGVEAPLKLMNRFFLPLSEPPLKVYREYKIPADAWGMFGNDTIGDCTCAAIAHMLMVVTAHTGKIVIPTEQDVIRCYSAVSGYDPSQTQDDGTNPTDNGADLPTVLDYWRDVGLAGHKILTWGDIDPKSKLHQQQAIYVFGATDDAVELPASAMDAFNRGTSWTNITDQNIEGGHSIPRFGYGAEGATCVTWAKTQQGTWAWWLNYLTECCVVITQDWVNNATGLAPNMMNMDALNAALAAIKA